MESKPLYRIRDWDKHFEVAKTRNRRNCRFSWVPIPNKHDGKGYRRLMRHPQGPAIYCAWVLMVQVASKCPERGVLADEDGPLGPEELYLKTDCPAEVFEQAIPVLLEIGWLEQIGPASADQAELPDSADSTAGDAAAHAGESQHSQERDQANCDGRDGGSAAECSADDAMVSLQHHISAPAVSPQYPTGIPVISPRYPNGDPTVSHQRAERSPLPYNPSPEQDPTGPNKTGQDKTEQDRTEHDSTATSQVRNSPDQAQAHCARPGPGRNFSLTLKVGSSDRPGAGVGIAGTDTGPPNGRMLEGLQRCTLHWLRQIFPEHFTPKSRRAARNEGAFRNRLAEIWQRDGPEGCKKAVTWLLEEAHRKAVAARNGELRNPVAALHAAFMKQFSLTTTG